LVMPELGVAPATPLLAVPIFCSKAHEIARVFLRKKCAAGRILALS
jgi:hypothetical protein